MTSAPATSFGRKLALAFTRWWSITALVLALTMLAAAHISEMFGLNPCHLCLKQRDVYWIASGVALVASVWALFTGAKGPPRVFSFVLFAIFATGCAIAVYHSGVEWHWWRGPSTCSAGGGAEISLDDLIAFNTGKKSTAAMCDVAAWRDPVFGLSMAGYNAIVSAGLALVSLIASLRFRSHKRTTKS